MSGSREPGWRLPRGRLVLSTLLASLAAAASALATTANASGPSLPPPRVTMITDSVGGVVSWVDQAYAELAQGLQLRIDVRACRKLVVEGCYAYGEHPPSALATIKAIGARRDKLGSQLGKLVIVDVGYNDQSDTYAAGLDSVMAALRSLGVEHVIWVTLDQRQGVWVEINAQIRAAAARWPQLVVADWARELAGKPQWIADPVHLNDVGAIAFAHFLRPIVVATCGARCEPAGAPPADLQGG